MLEGSDLGLELVVELPQCLLLTDVILAVENLLFWIALDWACVLYLLFHFVEHLKKLTFVLLRWLDTGGRLLR